MRRIMIVMAFGLVAGYVQAQKLKESDVPLSVKQAFTQKFPKAKEVKWETEDATAIEADFEMEESEYSAKFSTLGKWLETESEIKAKELPEPIRTTISKEFAGFKIEEAEKAETSDQGTLYEVELEGKKISYAVQFTATGKILKKEEVKESDEIEKDK